tara:strand:- start:283 stop:717 length:435 start_codon:yes stop_codon:yes gene_type:complete
MRFVSFHTKLFFTDIPDEQLDSWFIGGDCSGWFYARLIPYNQMEPDLEPTMEDWGWIMTVKTNGIAVDIYVWEYLERHNSWVFGIAAKNKWLRKIPAEQLDTSEDTVARAIGAILEADNRFTQIEWSSENPLEKRPEPQEENTL